jgi:hypothetical protein
MQRLFKEVFLNDTPPTEEQLTKAMEVKRTREETEAEGGEKERDKKENEAEEEDEELTNAERFMMKVLQLSDALQAWPTRLSKRKKELFLWYIPVCKDDNSCLFAYQSSALRFSSSAFFLSMSY